MGALRSILAAREVRPNLGLARVLVGLALLGLLAETAPRLLRLAGSSVLRVPRLDALPVPSTGVVVVVLALWAAAAVGFLLGRGFHPAGAVCTALLGWALLLDQQLYSNHLYLAFLVTGLLTLSGADRYWTVGRGGSRRAARVAIWPVALLQIQLSLMYLFAAIAKLNAPFLSGTVIAASVGDGLVPVPEALLTPEASLYMAGFTVVVELLLAFGLWLERVRPVALAFGVALHLGITLTMAPTLEFLNFTLVVFALYLLFVDPLFVDRARTRPRQGGMQPPETEPPTAERERHGDANPEGPRRRARILPR